jgi:hypothetical protein
MTLNAYDVVAYLVDFADAQGNTYTSTRSTHGASGEVRAIIKCEFMHLTRF